VKLFREQNGSVAVEFALILPLLVALLIGIAEFGMTYNAQVTLSNAAREAARTLVVTGSSPSETATSAAAAARAAALAASPDLVPPLKDTDIAFVFTTADGAAVTPAACATGATATATIGYSHQLMTGFFGTAINLTGKAAMRCGG
jgi:Flp pilus assembly protein TadG